MHRVRLIATASVAGVALLGCSESQPPRTATTEVTAATWTTENRLQEENARLQKERDDARDALIDERADHARDLERYNADNAQRREHDDVEMRALEALSVADVQAETLRKKAKTAGAASRSSIDATLHDLEAAKANLRSQLQRLHGQMTTAAFESVKSDIEATLADLERATSKRRE